MGFTFISFEAVKRVCYQQGCRPVGRPKGTHVKNGPNEREIIIRDLFLNGETLQKIGELQAPAISRERVRQILKKQFGLSGKDGGKFKTLTPIKIAESIKNKKQELERNERKCRKVFGCSVDDFLSINGQKWDRKKGTPAMAFYDQRRNANARGIAWNITFPEWWKIWSDSGHYDQRGGGEGYCMTRVGDTGGYEVGNVKIKTIGENFSESFFKHPMEERILTAIKNGKPRQKTHCIRGHERNNLNIYPSGDCKLCAHIRYKKRSL
jgi:hypothetical protein